MGKKSVWKPEIENKLKEEDLTFKKLYVEVKKELKSNIRDDASENRSYNKNFLEAIVYLLNEGEITVKGFDGKPSKERFSSFKPDNLILSHVKKEKEDILSVLYGWTPPLRAKIQTAFLTKFRQYETTKNNIWDNLRSKVVSKSLKNFIKEMENELEAIEIRKGDEIGYELEDGVRHDELEESLYLYKAWYEEYENATLWMFNGDYKDYLKEYLQYNHSTAYKEIKLPTIQRDGKLANRLLDNSDVTIIHHSHTPLIDIESNWDVTRFFREWTLEEPIEKNTQEIMKMFRIIWFNVICSENYEVILNSFAWALSDEEDSLEWFELFIEGLSDTTPLKNKLFNKKYIKKPMDPYAMQAAEIRKANENRGKIVRQDESSDLEHLAVLLKKIANS